MKYVKSVSLTGILFVVTLILAEAYRLNAIFASMIPGSELALSSKVYIAILLMIWITTAGYLSFAIIRGFKRRQTLT